MLCRKQGDTINRINSTENQAFGLDGPDLFLRQIHNCQNPFPDELLGGIALGDLGGSFQDADLLTAIQPQQNRRFLSGLKVLSCQDLRHPDVERCEIRVCTFRSSHGPKFANFAKMKETHPKAFAPLTQVQWESNAVKSLKGKLLSDIQSTRFDGVAMPIWSDVAPEHVGIPRRAISAPEAGMPWQIQQTIEQPEDVANALLHGVQGLRVSAAACARWGLEELLKGVFTEMVDIHLDGPEATGMLRALMRLQDKRSDALGARIALTGACSLDVLRSDWDVSEGQSRLHRHITSWSSAFPAFRTWGADGSPWLETGMDAIDVVAWMLTGLDAQWNAWQSNGLIGEEVLQHAVLQWSVGTEVLVEAAALRALRRLWSKWLQFRGLNDVPVWIDAKTNPIRFERWKPEDNLLRCTASGYAAALGAADGMEVLPHDVLANDASSPEAKRWARNVQHLLIEESGIQSTHDPLQGSRVVEHLTQEFVNKAWDAFQELLSKGTNRPHAWLDERIKAGRLHRLSEGMFRPSDAPAVEGAKEGTEVVWDDLGRPLPLFLVDHLQSQKG